MLSWVFNDNFMGFSLHCRRRDLETYMVLGCCARCASIDSEKCRRCTTITEVEQKKKTVK